MYQCELTQNENPNNVYATIIYNVDEDTCNDNSNYLESAELE